ncbi:MAG: hypothetical protein WC877_01140 [Dehalococcoidales bacterium]|jgi:hypothetical protein
MRNCNITEVKYKNSIVKFLAEWESMSDEEKTKLKNAWKHNHEHDNDFQYTPCFSSLF